MRIINGRNATEGQFPYFVSIRYTKLNNDHNCGGSILSTRWIATAYHCFNNTIFTDTFATVGSNKLHQGTDYYFLHQVLPDKPDNFITDIVLLATTKKIDFKIPNIGMISIGEGEELKVGTTMRTCGFGSYSVSM